MQEENVGNNHGHDAFIGRRTKSTDDTSPQKGLVRSGTRLPNARGKADQATDERDWASSKNVGARDDDEVCISKRDDTRSSLEKEVDQS